MRRTTRRSFRGARSASRPTRTWVGVSGQFAMAGATATTAGTLIQLQAPADLSNLTSDPPEDVTVLRMRGSFVLALSTAGSWTLALLVQDTTWTPGTFLADSDKRMLWTETFNVAEASTWRPGLFTNAAGSTFPDYPGKTFLDIAPKVRIEPGKALFLVAYENTGTATLDISCQEMRVLFQRSPRRR